VDEASAERARKFLASFIDTAEYPLYRLPDTRSSELAKLLENSYRAVNIAFIHEWTLLAERLEIDLFEVIESILVRRSTHDNIRFPGFGVGGYCLTKDSLLAQWSLTRLFKSELTLPMTLDALRINSAMPLHTFDLLAELGGGEALLAGKAVALCGVSYLPEVADTRNSPSEVLADALRQVGATTSAHDPYVQTWPERPSVPLSSDLARSLGAADAIVFAVPHPLYRTLTAADILAATGKSCLVVDAQNILSNETADSLHAAGCRLLGVGKGHWRKRGLHRAP
jgi:nucleotide sugar dehydrogenase